MHNLKDLRKNLDIFKKKFKDRNLDFNIDEFNTADQTNRELINKKELLEQEKKKHNIKVKIAKEKKQGCSIFGSCLISGVKNTESPDWLKQKIISLI